jgi:hypothetical protein
MEKSIYKLYKAFLTIFVLSAFVLGISAACLAEPPPSCDQDNGTPEAKPLKACEEKLNYKQGALINALDGFIDEMENTPGVNMSGLYVTNSKTGATSDLKEHMEKLRREHGRAQAAIEESEEEDFEDMIEQAGKEKGKKCKGWKEADEVADRPGAYMPLGLFKTNPPDDRLGDGECNGFYALDENGVEVWVRERSQPNICERVCEDKEVPGQTNQTYQPYQLAQQGQQGQPKKKKDMIRGRHIDRKSDAIDATDRAITAINNSRTNLRAMNAMAKTLGSKYALNSLFPECDLSSNVPHIIAWGVKDLAVVVKVPLVIAYLVAEGSRKTVDYTCKQTAFGANTSFACTPLSIASAIAEGLLEAADIVIQAAELTSEGFDLFTADATHNCVKSTIGLVNGIDGKVNGLTNSVGTVGDDLN